jgi:hypothetical protein
VGVLFILDREFLHGYLIIAYDALAEQVQNSGFCDGCCFVGALEEALLAVDAGRESLCVQAVVGW